MLFFKKKLPKWILKKLKKNLFGTESAKPEKGVAVFNFPFWQGFLPIKTKEGLANTQSL
jgi:hypothetical protein